MQEFRDDTDSVSIGKIWLYAARKNEKVLYDLALSEWKRIGNRERRATLIFSLCILAIVDMLWPGLLLNSLILQDFANYAGWNYAVSVAVVAVVFFLWNLGNTLTPLSWEDFDVPLPGHPLSEQQAEEKEKTRVKGLATEQRKAEIESQIRMKESKSPRRPGPTQRPPE